MKFSNYYRPNRRSHSQFRSLKTTPSLQTRIQRTPSKTKTPKHQRHMHTLRAYFFTCMLRKIVVLNRVSLPQQVLCINTGVSSQAVFVCVRWRNKQKEAKAIKPCSDTKVRTISIFVNIIKGSLWLTRGCELNMKYFRVFVNTIGPLGLMLVWNSLLYVQL